MRKRSKAWVKWYKALLIMLLRKKGSEQQISSIKLLEFIFCITQHSFLFISTQQTTLNFQPIFLYKTTKPSKIYPFYHNPLDSTKYVIYLNLFIQMKRQYLCDFDEKQLERYLLTSKQRVNQMRQFTVALQKQNAQLSEEYTRMVNQKKHLYEESLKAKNHLLKWYDSGKEKVSGWIHKLVKEEKNSYEPQVPANKEPIQEKTANTNEEQTEESHKSAKGRLEEFYQNGKEKLGAIIDVGEAKIQELASTIKEKYNSSSKKKEAQEPLSPPVHQVSQFEQTLKRQVKQQIKSQQDHSKNLPKDQSKL